MPLTGDALIRGAAMGLEVRVGREEKKLHLPSRYISPPLPPPVAVLGTTFIHAAIRTASKDVPVGGRHVSE
jgi:hypothetical protein